MQPTESLATVASVQTAPNFYTKKKKKVHLFSGCFSHSKQSGNDNMQLNENFKAASRVIVFPQTDCFSLRAQVNFKWSLRGHLIGSAP